MKTFTKSALFLLWLIPMSFFAQSSVSGTVTDAGNGQPIPGVNIIIKGTTNGTSSDFDGNYVLNGVNNGDIIEFSYVGFIAQEFTYSGTSRIDVALQEDAAELEQVVVIGYGAARKKDLTGSVSTVTADDFNKGNIVSPENLLNGRVAGVNITAGGAPGSGAAIRIRGGGSLAASNDPLIVIDGLPVNNNVVGGSQSILSSINPNNIKSFTVLKDASAAAIYGNRASAGVIIIETIKGSKGLQVDYNFQSGIYTVPETVDVFSAGEFRDIVREQALINNSIDPSLLGNANTDWQKEIYRNAVSTDNNISIRGSLFDVLPVRLSLGHLDQEGLRLTSEFERSSATLVLNPTFLNGNLKFNLNANATFEKRRFANGVEGAAIAFDPTQPVYDANSPFGGFFEYDSINPDGSLNNILAVSNPVASLLQRNNRSEVNRYFGNFKVDYSLWFLPEVTATVNVGFDEQNGDGFNELSRENSSGQLLTDGTLDGARTEFTSYRRNTLFDSYLNYKKEFGGFNLDVTGGYSYQNFRVEDFNTGELRGDNDSNQAIRAFDPDLVLVAFFGRANFSVNDKYLLTLSYRRDGTSRFSEDNRWGNFPSAAFAWNISDENFLTNSQTLSNLKIRLGYGVTGQENIGAGQFNKLPYLAQYQLGQNTSQYIFGDASITVANPSLRNEELQWEVATQYNIGLDFGLFNDRINGSVDVYRRETEDLFISGSLPDGANFGNIGQQNLGELLTEGIELNLNADIIKGKNFVWNINYNAAMINQEVEKLVGGEDQLVGPSVGGTGGNIQLHREGFAPFSFLVFKQLYDANGAPIEGAYADLNGDNIINSEDKYVYRNRDADVTMGFQSNMTYKGFDLSFNLRASLGNYVFNGVANGSTYNAINNNGTLANLNTSVLDTNFNVFGDTFQSDIYVENASFLKMDNVTLGYTFTKFFGDTSSIRLWGGVQNVFTITEYSGLDPEIFSGVDQTIFPRARTFLMGANVKF
ncbi:SusC/RagA family TonB-linked outer membrane protein [Aquimarina sp. AD1]|uniref:SusC/RagA family TonB-linked outer membrane protein n=1 Tax=Aquimarina sp. (strain AD1) TaxID=1714848 RepID=UPI000E47E8D9|nr:SusC/RagA family TonB-linked outer membrane protein [Aquimarina sp. AD1]AXT55936.1 SusC/RagA family TonB-linked outer membrane protein [Aquimarina sp. AD1]RKN37691.1 SusC/RagA family TonB-linked outer membrane protein [Aquimarina sp. AD1]